MAISGANEANDLSRQITRPFSSARDFYNLKQGKKNMREGSSLLKYFICLVSGYKYFEL